MGGRFSPIGFLLVVTVGLVVAPGLALSAPTDGANAAVAADVPATIQHADEPRHLSQASTIQQECNYTELYNETIDSVVLIRTGGGLGSGFVYDAPNGSDGVFVVTNQHVVNETGRVLVKFARGETAPGTVVGTDALSDLAVIRVQRPPDYAEPLTLNEEKPMPGEPVAALGSPFGLQSTVTSGIVSGTNRSIRTRAGYAVPNTVQTDAPINPGNSGGPLVECATGDVVGVNRAGGGDNIGFAVPASIVERVVPALISEGDYDHAFLGAGTVEVTRPVAQANDLNTTEGVLVVRTIRGTPAGETLRESDRVALVAGARIPVGGDVIVGIGNRSVETPNDIARFLALEASPGETVEVTVLRDGERRIVNVTLVERPEPDDV